MSPSPSISTPDIPLACHLPCLRHQKNSALMDFLILLFGKVLFWEGTLPTKVLSTCGLASHFCRIANGMIIIIIGGKWLISR